MTDTLLRHKIEEALTSAGGDKHDAQKLLITWAVRDPQLLLELTKPHLKAIASGHIDHAVRQKDAPAHNGGGGKSGGRTAIDDLVASATMRVSGDKRRKSNLPPPKTTERQASAMRRIAEAFSKKKNED
ncbi:MAG: hypothetical protein JO126_02810 [Alphaproteobacteria bacterium]|nr:hypothetical protein [Alphaproteobacteria bacterium]